MLASFLAAFFFALNATFSGRNARAHGPARANIGRLIVAAILLGAFAHNLQWALIWNVFSLSCLGLTTANNLALCKVTLIPPPAIGLSVGVQQVAGTLSGGVAASLSGWLLHATGSYDAPMMVIVFFLMIGAAACVILLRPQWSPKVTPVAA